jgi:hypothetical protein
MRLSGYKCKNHKVDFLYIITISAEEMPWWGSVKALLVLLAVAAFAYATNALWSRHKRNKNQLQFRPMHSKNTVASPDELKIIAL